MQMHVHVLFSTYVSMNHDDVIGFVNYANVYQEHSLIMHLLMYSNCVEYVDM